MIKKGNNKVHKTGKWQKYKYVFAALIAIFVFCGFIFSYVAVVISASAPATKALNNISIINYTIQPSNTTPPLLSFSEGAYNLSFGQGYLNVTNTGDKKLTLTLTMSAIVSVYDGQDNKNITYNVGSMSIPNVIVNGHSTTNIQATLNDKTPTHGIPTMNNKPSGYWSYSCSVQASIPVSYLFWHTTVGCKTFDFTGSETIL